jgi:hypothetical protein
VDLSIPTSNNGKPGSDTIADSDSSRTASSESRYTRAGAGSNAECERRAAANHNDQNTSV